MDIAIPFGKGKLVILIASMVIQAVLQLGGVASVLPFLSVAANPENFATSPFGQFLTNIFRLTDPRQLVYVTGIFAIAFLIIASASAIANQVIAAKYTHRLGHWLRHAASFQILQPALLLLCFAQLRCPN